MELHDIDLLDRDAFSRHDAGHVLPAQRHAGHGPQGPLSEPVRLRSNFINGLKHLPVRLVAGGA